MADSVNARTDSINAGADSINAGTDSINKRAGSVNAGGGSNRLELIPSNGKRFRTYPHITSRHITSHHSTSQHITSNHVTPRHITSHHACRIQNPDIPRAGRVSAHGGAAGRGRAGLGANRIVRPEDKRPANLPRHRRKYARTSLQKHEQAKSYVNRWRNKTRG